jgi:hypothetical protein
LLWMILNITYLINRCVTFIQNLQTIKNKWSIYKKKLKDVMNS